MSTHINELKEYLNASFLDKKVRVRGFVPEDHHSVPEMVSIGPHFSNLSLPIDDNVKIQLASFLIWSSYRPVSFDSYKAAIEDILEEGMQFYSETSPSNWTGESTEEIRSSTEEIEEIRSSTEEIRSRFRSMFLLDGCFIVYLIDALCNGDESGGRFFGIISAKKCYRDLCLLLNQIPFVVVQKLLSVRLYGSKSNSPDVMIKVHQYLAAFCRYIISGYRVRYSQEIDLPNFGAARPAHLLDLVRMYMGSSTLGSSTLSSHHVNFPIGLAVTESVLNENNVYSAYMLRENLGISFEVGNVLELGRIGFQDGHFKLPKVIISEHSETLFVNLISCEDALDKNGVICTFMWLMGVLARDERSVGILKDKHIIVSEFEDTKIVDIFKRVSRRLLPQILYLEGVLHQIGVYKKSRYMPWRRCAFRMLNFFFGNIGRGFSTLSGLLVLVLTVMGLFPILKELIKKIFRLNSHESDVGSIKGWSGI